MQFALVLHGTVVCSCSCAMVFGGDGSIGAFMFVCHGVWRYRWCRGVGIPCPGFAVGKTVLVVVTVQGPVRH